MAKRRSRSSPLRLGLLAGLAGGLLAGLAAAARRRARRRSARHNAAFDRAAEGLWPPVPPKSPEAVTIAADRATPDGEDAG